MIFQPTSLNLKRMPTQKKKNKRTIVFYYSSTKYITNDLIYDYKSNK